ncbi:MAG: ABC transporter permease [Verrucomicrobia bacterium]|nr:ABC transporter permease [Verrucomicrobiota bacterium]
MRSVVESEGAPAAFAKVSLQEKEATIALGGTWNLKGSVRPKSATTLNEVQSADGITRVRCVGQDLGTWDSSLLLFLSEVDEWCQAHQIALDLHDLPEGVGSLIALAKAVPEAETKSRHAGHVSFLYQLGAWAIGQSSAFTAAATFIGECVLSLMRIATGKGKVDWRLFWLTMQESGFQALPIVGLISFLTGLILAFVASIQLRQFGAGIYVANLVAVAMAREMGAIMTGVIMAGRTGAAFAAQIGSMKVSEEIDALDTLAISPMDFLVSPRVVALFLMMPLLGFYSDLLGIAGGAVVGLGVLHITLLQYWNQTVGSMGLEDIITGVVKSGVFGVIVALTGCQRGMNCQNNAAAVGNAATSAVVLAITWIVASDAIIDVVLDVLKL